MTKLAGQFPVAYYLGPYLPDIAGAIVCFVSLLLLLKIWRPRTVLGYGGSPVSATGHAGTSDTEHGLTTGEVLQAWMPFAVLVIVVGLCHGNLIEHASRAKTRLRVIPLRRHLATVR